VVVVDKGREVDVVVGLAVVLVVDDGAGRGCVVNELDSNEVDSETAEHADRVETTTARKKAIGLRTAPPLHLCPRKAFRSPFV
jgi:hypothetical protein